MIDGRRFAQVHADVLVDMEAMTHHRFGLADDLVDLEPRPAQPPKRRQRTGRERRPAEIHGGEAAEVIGKGRVVHGLDQALDESAANRRTGRSRVRA